MGDFRVRTIKDAADRKRMYEYAIDDVKVFEKMLEDDVFVRGALHIGAEQELCIIDKNGDPLPKALHILDRVNDEHYTNELALFNLEINLDPYPLTGDCFGRTEKELLDLLSKGEKLANSIDGRLLMTGILPSLQYRHLQFEYMTPIQRYQTLSNTLFQLRGEKFEIHLQGVDEIMMSLNSVLFEACNTSFQLHLQIHPKDFVAQHNWSQMIAGPVLSACVNSPLLFGNELWAETRIALFKQSLDTRSSNKYLRRKLPRVYFGEQWLEKSAAELWKADLMRFPLIVTSDDLVSSSDQYQKGEIPKLRGIRLHNGTTYTWNRLCYGFSGKEPHLRIECRYLPAGPTPIDEVANFAFWIGLMCAPPSGETPFWNDVDFREIKGNFVKAARTGLNSVFLWKGKPVPAAQLILDELLPLAKTGLRSKGIDAADIDRYLGVIQQRIENHVTGGSWMVNRYRDLQKTKRMPSAIRQVISELVDFQSKNIPVGSWPKKGDRKEMQSVDAPVEEFMSDNLYALNPDSSIDIAQKILQWRGFHHLPVEDQDGDLVGLVTDGLIKRAIDGQSEVEFVHEVMIENPLCVSAQDSISEAKQKMNKHGLSGMPVVYEKKLVGIITLRDIPKDIG